MKKSKLDFMVGLGLSIIGTIFITSFFRGDSLDVAISTLNVLDPMVRLFMLGSFVFAIRITIIDEYKRVRRRRHRQCTRIQQLADGFHNSQMRL